MSTVESPPPAHEAPAQPNATRSAGRARAGLRQTWLSPERLGWGAAVAVLLAFAFGLRIWGGDHGLPYAYNADENSHFVTHAIGLFGHGWDPQVLRQPARLHISRCTCCWAPGMAAARTSRGVRDRPDADLDPARLSVGDPRDARRLADLPRRHAPRRPPRRPAVGRHLHGRLPAGLLLPSSRSTTYRRWRRCAWRCGAWRACCASGACATTSPPGSASASRARRSTPAGSCSYRSSRRRSCSSRRPAGAPARRAASRSRAPSRSPRSWIANPYAILNWAASTNGLNAPVRRLRRRRRKLGLTQNNGFAYYIWSFGWGVGWIPLLFAVGGAVRLWFDERRSSGCSCPAIVLFFIFMGSQERYFGRWLMPVFPLVCILAAYAAFELVDHGGRWKPALKPTFVVAAVVAVCAQGFVYSLHSGLVTSREDTRNLASRLDGGPRAARHEDRRRAGRARRVGAGHRQARRCCPTATAG